MAKWQENYTVGQAVELRVPLASGPAWRPGYVSSKTASGKLLVTLADGGRFAADLKTEIRPRTPSTPLGRDLRAPAAPPLELEPAHPRDRQLQGMLRGHAEDRARRCLLILRAALEAAQRDLDNGKGAWIDVRNLGAPFADLAQATGVLRALDDLRPPGDKP